MSDQQFFRKYIDIINEESPVFQQRNNANAQKWAKENPEAAQYAKLATDVVTDYIPGVSQVKSAYRAGKAALGGDYGEAGKQLVGAFVPGGRRMVSAVDAAGNALKGDYKTAAANLSHAAGGELGRAVSTGLAANDLYKAYGPSTPTTTPTTQTAQANITATQTAPAAAPNTAATTGTYTPGPALQSLTKQASTTAKAPEPTTEEQELDENGRMRKLLDMLDEAPVTAINPNDPNAAAFGKKINAPTQTNTVNNQSSGYTAQSQAQKTPSVNTNQSDLASQYISANQTKSQPAVNNQSSGYNAQSQAQNTLKSTQSNAQSPTFTGMAGSTTNKTPGLTAATTGGGYSTPQSNVDTAATAARDRLQQQMASGKIAAPAPQVVNPNQQYGGGYDPTKVQYASGGNPKAAPAASATQSAASDTAKANAIGGGMQQMAQQATPVNNQSSGYTAQSQAQNTLPQTTTTASTGGGFKGGGYGSVGGQGQAAAAPTQTSDQIATAALNAPSTQTASADQSTSGQSLGRPAAFGQVAEEELEEELQTILRLSGRKKGN